MWRQDTGMQNLAPAPIPTYEEATSRPSSSQRARGPAEISDDAERQNFLGASGLQNSAYRHPTVESARNSLDSTLSVPDMVDDEHDARRQLEELDYMEPGASEEGQSRQARLYHRARLRNKFSQHLSTLSATLGSIRLPSFRRLYTPVATETESERPIGGPPAAVRWSPFTHLPENYRISVPIFARLVALFVIGSFVWLLFTMDLFPSAFRRHGMAATMFDPESVREFVQEHLDMEEIQHYLGHLSSFAHEAGSEGNFYMANWMESKWGDACDLDTIELKHYTILADYPVEDERWVKITSPQGQDWGASWEETLAEDRPDREQTLAWHGYSKSGSVEGQLIYANRGTQEDFDTLHQNDANTTGAIALIDVNGGESALDSALKVRFAQEAGCIGVLLCNMDHQNVPSDLPADVIPSNDTLHRTNVALSNWILGDPLTPGWPSVESNKERASETPGLPSIPSLPISFENAARLRLLATNAQPPPQPVVVANLRNQNEDVREQKIWNLHGTIRGAEYPNQKVIVGAPRDSWCFGASDSASASALLTGIVAVFGELLKSGWRPLRTVEFVSWDGRTLNSAGSTEYVEDLLDSHRESTIAYVNVESGFGDDFYARGSPLLQRALQHAMDRVVAPGENETMRTIFDTEELGAAAVTPLRLPNSDGDFAAFAHIAGVPVLDLGFRGMPQDLVRGSCRDTMSWLEKFGDKRANVHQALVQTWALLVLNLLAAPLLPMDTQTYVDRLSDLIDNTQTEVQSYLAKSATRAADFTLDFEPLHSAVQELNFNTVAFHKFETDWTATVMSGGGLEDLYWHRRRGQYNSRLAAFEKAFLDIPGPDDEQAGPGLKDRPQFKHILFAPEKWSVEVQGLPTIWEALEEQRWDAVQPEIERIARIIKRAGLALIADS